MKKRILSLALALVLLTGTALATNGVVQKKLQYMDIKITVDGEVMSKTTNEYEEFKVSWDYREPNVTNDPLYLYFLMN